MEKVSLVYRYSASGGTLEPVYIGVSGRHLYPSPDASSLTAVFKANDKLYVAQIDAAGKVVKASEYSLDPDAALVKVFKEPFGSRFLLVLSQPVNGDASQYIHLLIESDGDIEAKSSPRSRLGRLHV